MQLSDEARHIVASNLTIAAALLQLVNTAKHKTTTAECDSEATKLFNAILSRLGKYPAPGQQQ